MGAPSIAKSPAPSACAAPRLKESMGRILLEEFSREEKASTKEPASRARRRNIFKMEKTQHLNRNEEDGDSTFDGDLFAARKKLRRYKDD